MLWGEAELKERPKGCDILPTIPELGACLGHLSPQQPLLKRGGLKEWVGWGGGREMNEPD